MKSTIKSTAIYLMSIKGKTSTLEVKNEIHRQKNDPSFVLRQYEVSTAMKQLAQEEGWKGEFNGTYIEYSLPTAPDPVLLSASDDDDINDNVFWYDNGQKSPSYTVTPSIVNPTTTSTANVTLKSNITSQITGTIPGLDPLKVQYASKDPKHDYVGYISGNPNFYATGVDKNDVRRKIFLVATAGYGLNITYDDINFCTRDYFVKKYH